MGETVKIRKVNGSFPENVAGFGGYVAKFNEQGVAEVDATHALHFLQFPNEYKIAKADVAKLPPMSAYAALVKEQRREAPKPAVQHATVDPEDYLSVNAGNVQPDSFDDEEDWFDDGGAGDADSDAGNEGEDDGFEEFHEEDGDGDGVNHEEDGDVGDSQQSAANVCSGCGKAFANKAGLTTHMRSCAALKA